jgi:hypothetical protein
MEPEYTPKDDTIKEQETAETDSFQRTRSWRRTLATK